MDYVIIYAIGLIIGAAIMYGIMRHRNHDISSDLDARGIGTLYIYEGSDRDRYSFAFDCPLDQVGNFKKVTLEVKKQREKSLKDIENDLFAEDFDTNMSNF